MTKAELIERGHSPKSERYFTPAGGDITRRDYGDVQAKSVGYSNYAQYQGEIKKPIYSEILSRSSDPEAARRLDSTFNSTWAKNIRPKLVKGGRIPIELWRDAYSEAHIPRDDEIWEWYHW